jgi:putrescine transport system permease protein
MKNYYNKSLYFVIIPYFWLCLLLFAPFILIAIISISEYSTGIPPFKPFFQYNSVKDQFIFAPTLENFSILIKDNLYLKAYLSSLKIASISTIIALLIGYPIALILSQTKESLKNVLLVAIVLPFWISLIIRVYSWNVILEDNGFLNKLLLHLNLIDAPISFLNSQTAVIIGIVYCYLPFMVLPIFIILEKIDKSLIEAALDLGCTPFATFYRVILPLSLPGLITGSLLVFIPAVGEFVVPDLLGGNQIITVGKIIWNEFFYNKDWPVAAAITVTLAIIFVAPMILIQKYINKEEDE